LDFVLGGKRNLRICARIGKLSFAGQYAGTRGVGVCGEGMDRYTLFVSLGTTRDRAPSPCFVPLFFGAGHYTFLNFSISFASSLPTIKIYPETHKILF
jgi:hypothetical protein